MPKLPETVNGWIGLVLASTTAMTLLSGAFLGLDNLFVSEAEFEQAITNMDRRDELRFRIEAANTRIEKLDPDDEDLPTERRILAGLERELAELRIFP